MLSKPIKALKEVGRKLIPTKGINRKGNVEESELLDCENEEIPIEEYQEECNNEEEKETNEDVEPEENNESLSLFTNDPDIKADSKFLDKFQEIMKYNKASKLFIPYMSQF